MSMTFVDLVEEVRHRPLEERVELREILEKNLIASRREQIYQNHLETRKELKHGTLNFTSDVDELMRELKQEE